MRINTNLTAMNTFNQVTKNQNNISSAVAKLSSGYAINSAADNAAGLAISEKMRAQIHGLDKASSNAQDAISLVQTAEGALDSSTQILQRMRQLAVQSSSDTNENIDRNALQDEFSQLQKELNDISGNTTFNKKSLLDGSLATTSTSIGGQTAMATGNLSASVGNAAAGLYNFSVSVVKTQDAVAAKAADKLTVSQDTLATDYVSSAKGSATGIVDKSSLLNGNYTITKADYSGSGSFKLTATGGSDGKQTFQATIDMNALNTTTNHTITANFTDGTNTFSVDFSLADKAAVNNKDYTTTNIGTEELKLFGDSFAKSGTSFAISGGIDAVQEKNEVQASITGASNVTLKAGDSSATFDNGVTVNFAKLTSTDLDTIANYNNSGTSVTANVAGTTAAINVNNKNSHITSGTATITAPVIATYSSVVNGTAVNTTNASVNAQITNFNGLDQSVNTAVTATNWTVNADKSVSFKWDNNVYTSKALDDNAANKALVGGSGAESFDVNFVSSAGKTLTVTFKDVVANATDYTQFGAVALAAHTGANGLAIGSAASANAATYNVKATVQDPSGGSTVYTAKMDALGITNPGTKTLDFKYAGDTDTAFSATLTNTSGAAITDATLTGAINTLAFTIGKAQYAHQNTFGTTSSKIEVAKTANAGLTFQVGANEGDSLTINVDRMDTEFLGVNGVRVDTRENASKAITTVDKAINQVSAQRATLGAVQNRLQYKIDNLNTSSQNLTAAESQIRDVDMAKEMTAFTNANILSQASTAMLAQANSLPQSVLKLIGG